MTFPPFFSGMLISSSALISLLFAILTFMSKEYKSKTTVILLGISIILISLSNIYIIFAFYHSDILIQTDPKYFTPLIIYIIGIVFFIFSGIYFVYGKYAKTIP